MLNYINFDKALDIYKITIEKSGGGLSGYINIGQLESILFHVQNDTYYPTFVDKLTHMIFSIVHSHCFIDGNKRIAFALGIEFLLINGYILRIRMYIDNIEDIIFYLADGKIPKELLREFLQAIIAGEVEKETLKLKIIHAIDDACY